MDSSHCAPQRSRASSGPDKVEQQMTPMIDIVFQLLTFFVMSFKIATQEGDFNVKMPLGGAPPDPNQVRRDPQSILVQLTALPDGQLREIRLNQRSLGTSFPALRQQIADLHAPLEEVEVEFDCDYHLHYNNVINAISAVSGQITGEGKTIRYVDKIKFTPTTAPR
jgi:biopolymer transport protein ExbD